MIGERHHACQEDRDCPDRQYCYIVHNAFKHCVKYIVCSNYNRIEAKKLARDPHNCGPCIKGYKTHVFEDGSEVPKCDKEDNDLATDITIYVIVAIILIVFLGAMFIAIYNNFNKIKNYISKRSSRFSTKSIEINQNNTTIANINEDTVVPIASAPEQCPFIEKANSNMSPYNNEMIAQNKFQTATACQAPIWIQNANYGTNILTYPSDEIIPENASEENPPIQSSATVNITIEEIPSGPELNIQHDNDNVIMLPSSPTYSPNNSANEDNEADSDANNSASSSQPADINRETFQDKMKNIFINQSVNQLITMNVNLNNES